MEGKDVRVKLGTSKKEQIDAALKELKDHNEKFKKGVKDVRHEMTNIVKKLEKILPQEQIKILQKELEKLCTNKEADAKKVLDSKEKEIKGA